MNVGFYYHVESVFEDSGSVRVPALLGMFVRELAKQVGHVTFYTHGESSAGIEDDILEAPLVRGVDLGPRPRFPVAMFFPGRSLRAFRPKADGVDVVLIRGPTPLLPHLIEACGDIPTVVHIVGKYSSEDRASRDRSMPQWRDVLLRLAFQLYARRQRRISEKTRLLVNSPHLIDLFDRADVGIVMDSTLTEDSVVERPRRSDPEAGRERPARLLLTGRLIPEKGLWEAAEAVRLLRDRGFEAELDVVGWQVPTDPVFKAYTAHLEALGVADRVRFVGYVPAGPELAAVYEAADIFLLPTSSQSEGFPRSILEAMGAGIPVVTTPVCGIPHWIEHGREALLVEPRSGAAVADAVELLLTDARLYETTARTGWEFAQRYTIEKCSASLARHLVDWASGRPITAMRGRELTT
jgi:glycosyltransferase involved in cell wall biosynthesis